MNYKKGDNMIINNEELERRLNNYCAKHNINKNIFEIATIGNGYGNGERKRLYGPKTVKNKECTYVIKLFKKYNLIIIWNYKNNKAMSYSYITIENKLSKGLNYADKGRISHTNDQSTILFEHTENFENILNKIVGKI